jgi:hypothetical protein
MQFMCCQAEHVSQQIQGEPLSRVDTQTQRISSGGSQAGLGGVGFEGVVALRRLEGLVEEVLGWGEGEMVLYLWVAVSDSSETHYRNAYYRRQDLTSNARRG